MVPGPRRAGLALTFVKPCYWIIDTLTSASTVVDIGLGPDADFSQDLIRRYGLKAFGFDPTRAHHRQLEEVEAASNGRFILQKTAVGAHRGSRIFHESRTNVSGSFYRDHVNVRHDATRDYPVEVVTLSDALSAASEGRIALAKVDIEGSEYEAFEGAEDAVLRRAEQWVVEFHHDVVGSASFKRTRRLLRRFAALGYDSFSRDNVNFLIFDRSLRRGRKAVGGA